MAYLLQMEKVTPRTGHYRTYKLAQALSVHSVDTPFQSDPDVLPAPVVNDLP